MMGKSHDEYMIEVFRDEPEYAAFMVNSILDDGNDQGELKIILEWISAAGLRASFAPATAKAKPRARARAGDVIRDVFIPDDRTEPRARAKMGAAKTAAKRAKQAPAAKPTKRAAPATKRAKTAPSAKRAKATPTTMAGSAGRSRSRAPMAAAGA